MTSFPTPVRIGIVGTGAIAHAHGDAIRALDGRALLTAVADLDRQRAADFAAPFEDAVVYPSADALLASGSVDLLHICTPPHTHAPLAMLAMRAGVVALVEKPTALSLAEIDELVQVEKETGVPTLTVFQHRFGPAAVHLRRMVSSGALGRPLVATCDTLWYRPNEYFDVPWRGRWEIEGGGPTMGHGIHQFDLLLSVLGQWSAVSSFAARQSRPTNTEDLTTAIVRFENGALATVVNSLVSPRETSRLRFDFEHASVEVEHLYGYTTADWVFTAAPGYEHLEEQWNAVTESAHPTAHQDQLVAILDAMAQGEEPVVSLTEARNTLDLAASIYASAFRKHVVQAGSLHGDDPFMRSMSGGIVPWEPVKGAN